MLVVVMVLGCCRNRRRGLEWEARHLMELLVVMHCRLAVPVDNQYTL